LVTHNEIWSSPRHICLLLWSIISIISQIVGLHEFVGNRFIKSFVKFISSKDEGLFNVVACYFGVDEGVDKWIDYHYFVSRYLTDFLVIEHAFDY